MCGRLFTAILITLYMSISAMADFAEIPSNVTVELGTPPPPFRCRHTSSEAIIAWTVNGSSVGQFPDVISSSVNENGNLVHTLTIPAKLQYNGTVVECLAVFLDGPPPERTPAATILFATTSPTITTTNSPIFEPASFDLVPSPLTVAVEQETATFQCQHSLAVAIGWRVNGTSLNTANFQDITPTSTPGPDGVSTHKLSIRTLLEYNRTAIECVATFLDGSLPQVTTSVPLLIQDIPQKVENITIQRDYSNDELTTLWSPLPTLDINDTDPDILYIVKLYKITCHGQNILIRRTEVGGNNITEEGLDLMQIYKADITARNNVEGARNGQSTEMEEKFMSLNISTLVDLTRNFRIIIQSDDPVPSYYVMILESLDGYKDNLVVNITAERNGEVIEMRTEETVPQNSLWRASILAYGCESDRVVTDYELSTHDIQNVVVGSLLPGQISVIGDVISGATATGVLVIVYSLTNSNDVHYMYMAKKTEGSRIILDVTGLTETEYGVSTFALENGLPLPRVVASPKNITVLKSNQDQAPQQLSLSIEYDLIRTSSGVCITCTFLDSSSTGCVAVVHQRISQLNSSGLMNIELSHKFTRFGDTAYGCIEGINLEQYQVGAINVRMIMPTEEPSDKRGSSLSGAIVGAVLTVVVFSVTAVVTAMIVFWYLRKRPKLTAEAPPLYSEVGKTQFQATQNMVNGSDGVNPYHNVEVTPLMEENSVGEDRPLVIPHFPSRVVDDGVLTFPLPPHKEDSGLPRNPVTSGNGSSGGDPTYSQPMLPKLPSIVPTPAATEKLVYDEIQTFQNPEVKSTNKTVDDLHQVVYSEIQPQPNNQVEATETKPTYGRTCHTGTPPANDCSSITVDQLFSHLLPLASKWLSLGLALSLNEDRLDEICTNNEMDEDCLREMLELYMMRSDLDHSWEDIKSAIRKIDLELGVQESDSASISPVIHGSNRFSCDLHTKMAEFKSGHFADIHVHALNHPRKSEGALNHCSWESESALNCHPWKLSDKTLVLSGRRWHSIEGTTTAHSMEESNGTQDVDCPEYESEFGTSFGHQTTLQGYDADFGRTLEKEEEVDTPLSSPTTCSLCSTTGQNYEHVHTVERFCMTTEDERNEEDLIKISAIHCQDSHTHMNYKEALMHQMRLHKGQIIRDKLCNNNAIEESFLVHPGNEHLYQQLPHASKLLNQRHVDQLSHSITQKGDQNIDCTSDCTDHESLTTEQFTSFLLPHASKWQALGKALSLDEDQLDEIFTNSETDEACLQVMLELYMMRSDLDHSWEVIQASLKKIDSHSHKEALMGLQTAREKLEYNNAVEESSLVHSGNEHLDQQLPHASKLLNQRHVAKTQ